MPSQGSRAQGYARKHHPQQGRLLKMGGDTVSMHLPRTDQFIVLNWHIVDVC